MLISRLAHPVRNLGFGTRAGIWTQGCTLRCAGCMSRDTWGFRADRELPVEEIGAWLLALPGELDGVTVSGGEPTEQPELPGLLAMLRCLGKARREDWDLLVFTGLEEDVAAREHPWLGELADIVVAGPFVQELAGDHWLRGSGNQVLLRHTPLAGERYPGPPCERPGLDFAVADGQLWLTGIPRPGELEDLHDHLSAEGIHLRQTSWKGNRHGTDLPQLRGDLPGRQGPLPQRPHPDDHPRTEPGADDRTGTGGLGDS